MRSKDGRRQISNNRVAMSKKVGDVFPWMTIGPMMSIRVEILAIGNDGIVFLIGFAHDQG